MVYRIYTEDKGNLEELTIPYFNCFTIHNTVGWWYGKAESSVIIEIVGKAGDRHKVLKLKDIIQKTNYQESVLVVESPGRAIERRKTDV